MADIKNKRLTTEYVYDFAVDGGLVSEIVLSTKANHRDLPADAVITGVHSHTETACTSGGSATVSWGTNTDPDGYSGTAKAVATLTLDSVFSGVGDSGALLPSFSDADQTFSVTIATAALTAGKILFSVEYYRPGRDE